MKKIKRMSKKRMVLVLVLACVLFLGLTFRTGYLQIVKGDWLSTKAIDQQTREIPIEPKRGTIYDATGKNVLAMKLSNRKIITGKQTDILYKQHKDENLSASFR